MVKDLPVCSDFKQIRKFSTIFHSSSLPERPKASTATVRKCDFVYDSKEGEGEQGAHKKSRRPDVTSRLLLLRKKPVWHRNRRERRFEGDSVGSVGGPTGCLCESGRGQTFPFPALMDTVYIRGYDPKKESKIA